MLENEFNVRTREVLEALEYKTLSPFAAKSDAASTSRLLYEEEHRYRTSFQRDRDRIVHSRAFRRLKHKRQVFLTSYGDHYRTRLTHTIEVSQLSRTLARALALNEDLVEAIALGHDMGHTPFGHVGEVVLHRIMKGEENGGVTLTDQGGFKHNYQSVRIVDANETKYDFDGLNLTSPVREGILKHTRLRRHDLHYPQFRYDGLEYQLDHATTLEGQIVAVCDEIAQRTHDLEDGIRAKYVSLENVRKQPLIRIVEQHTGLSMSEMSNGFLYRNRLIRKLVNFLVTDVIEQTLKNMQSFYAKNQRYSFIDEQLVWFSPEIDPDQANLDTFIMKEIILKAKEERSDDKAIETITTLFRLFYSYPNLLPPFALVKCMNPTQIPVLYEAPQEKRAEIGSQLQQHKSFARAVCDHVAGMTDQYAEKYFDILSKLSQTVLWQKRGDVEFYNL